jgi:hypothetical protein
VRSYSLKIKIKSKNKKKNKNKKNKKGGHSRNDPASSKPKFRFVKLRFSPARNGLGTRPTLDVLFSPIDFQIAMTVTFATWRNKGVEESSLDESHRREHPDRSGGKYLLPLSVGTNSYTSKRFV